MKQLLVWAGMILFAPGVEGGPMRNFHDLEAKLNNGKAVKLSEYKGKVLLVVNTASECGYTPQYEQLEELQKKYGSKGFTVLGFPANDFGAQEPGSNEEIAKFCKLKFGTTFPLFDKQPVSGAGKQDVFAYLTEHATMDPGEVKWNFEKFLVDQNGKVVGRYRSKVKPDAPEVVSKIESLLKK